MVAASHWRQPSWAGHTQLHTPTTTAQNHNQHGRAMPCSMLSLYIPLSLSHPPYRTLSHYICISVSLPLPVYPSLYLSAYPSQPPLSHPLLAPPQSASSNKIYMGTRATHVSNSLRIIRCALCADSKFHIQLCKHRNFPKNVETFLPRRMTSRVGGGMERGNANVDTVERCVQISNFTSSVANNEHVPKHGNLHNLMYARSQSWGEGRRQWKCVQCGEGCADSNVHIQLCHQRKYSKTRGHS